MSWALFWWSVLAAYVAGVFIAGTAIATWMVKEMPERALRRNLSQYPSLYRDRTADKSLAVLVGWAFAGIGIGLVWPISLWVGFIILRSGSLTIDYLTPEDVRR